MTRCNQKVILEAHPDAASELLQQVSAEVSTLLIGFTLKPYILFAHRGIIFRVAQLEPGLEIKVTGETEIEIVSGQAEQFADLIKVQSLESLLAE